MIRLKPILEIAPPECPECHSTLAATGFLIPGMRNLAAYNCPGCENEFFGDLPAGQGLYTPIIINKKSGAVYDDYGVDWFAEWLADSYADRKQEALGFEVRQLAPVKKKVILLNCLDTLYGHSLLKLLNAQYYIDFQPDFSLIVLVPSFLEWMVPAGVAEAWIVNLPLRAGTVWNDGLAAEINRRLESFSEVFLSTAFSHPQTEDFNIERFTGITPFPLENFRNLPDTLVITFIWREDRLWSTADEASTPAGIFGIFKRGRQESQKRTNEQKQLVIRFAEALRNEFPRIDFAVAGIGQAGTFPDWISDLRLTTLDTETERMWCRRYAKSHLVVGVHGSNMLLPSAHAGGVIELIGEDRQGNFLQDILFRTGDAREIMFRYRFVPPSTMPENLAGLASTMLRYEDFRRLMSPEFCRHREQYDFAQWLSLKRRR